MKGEKTANLSTRFNESGIYDVRLSLMCASNRAREKAGCQIASFIATSDSGLHVTKAAAPD